MWADNAQLFFESRITWGCVTLILAAIAYSGKVNVTISHILLGFAVLVGGFQIFRLGLGIHLRIVCFFVFCISLTLISWWITGTTYHKENVQSEMKKIHSKRGQNFEKDFPLGYAMFALVNTEFFPFQGTEGGPFLVHWERHNYKWEYDGDSLILHLPEIDIAPNIMMYELTVKLPSKIGASLSFNIDAKSYKHGMAIVNNTFQFNPKPISSTKNITSQLSSGVRMEIPSEMRIQYLTQSTVKWARENYLELGNMNSNGKEIGLDGGYLSTDRSIIFDELTLVRGNTFIGGPPGGYRFPKATTILGNVFEDSFLDASFISDNAVISANRFSSRSGVFNIGLHPGLSFVVEIVETGTNGAVMLFGARSYEQ